MRVLIVDDHEIVRKGIRTLLASSEAFEVCGEAVDGRDAITKARDLLPDVITMDISMPNLNGLDATREIRRFLPEAPILIMSQHDVPEMMKQALRAGATAYIVKSAITTELLPALERARRKEIAAGLVYGSSHPTLNVQEFIEQQAELDRATRELEVAHAHLELVTNHAAAAVTRCSRDMTYLWANPGYAEWMQLPLSQIIGHSIEEVLGTQAFHALLPEFQRALRGEKVAYEHEIELARLGKRWVSANYTPTFDAKGVPDGWVAVVSDVTAHHQLEQALRDSEARLSAEATALQRVHELSSALWATNDLQFGLQRMLAASIELLGADKGNVQLLDPGRRVLTVVAQHGFDNAFLEFFREVSVQDDCVCAWALRTRETIVVPDIEADQAFGPYLAAARAAGYRAVTSMPLIASDGTFLGVISTHFASAHAPSPDSLRRLELYTRQAADFVVRCRSRMDLELMVDQRTDALLQANEQLRKLSALLLRAQDDERRRIARELHDGVGQLLAAVTMNIGIVSREKSKLSDTAAQCVTENMAMIRQITDGIRTMSYLLHPPLLEERGLRSALLEYVKGFEQRSNFTVTLELPETLDRLPPEYEISLFRIVQESLTNVHRHSQGSTALVRLQVSDDGVNLEVADDGVGINTNGNQNSGVGVRGMRERVHQLGGSLKVSSAARGTTVYASLPAPPKPAAATSA